MTAAFWVASVLFAGTAVMAVIRIVRGPSILDRMIASDVLLSCLMLVVGLEMVVSGHTRTIPLMLVIAGTATFATIAVARYVSKQDRAELDADGTAEESLVEGTDASDAAAVDEDPLADTGPASPDFDGDGEGGRADDAEREQIR